MKHAKRARAESSAANRKSQPQTTSAEKPKMRIVRVRFPEGAIPCIDKAAKEHFGMNRLQFIDFAIREKLARMDSARAISGQKVWPASSIPAQTPQEPMARVPASMLPLLEKAAAFIGESPSDFILDAIRARVRAVHDDIASSKRPSTPAAAASAPATSPLSDAAHSMFSALSDMENAVSDVISLLDLVTFSYSFDIGESETRLCHAKSCGLIGLECNATDALHAALQACYVAEKLTREGGQGVSPSNPGAAGAPQGGAQ
jgi:hypothetical protein